LPYTPKSSVPAANQFEITPGDSSGFHANAAVKFIVDVYDGKPGVIDAKPDNYRPYVDDNVKVTVTATSATVKARLIDKAANKPVDEQTSYTTDSSGRCVFTFYITMEKEGDRTFRVEVAGANEDYVKDLAHEIKLTVQK
jgi:hypothetical protein